MALDQEKQALTIVGQSSFMAEDMAVVRALEI